MEIITSQSNRLVKKLTRLKQKKYREEYNEFFIEGLRNVLDTAEYYPSSVHEVVLSESAYAACAETFKDFQVYVLSDALFAKISETETSQGVLSVNGMADNAFPSSERCVLLDRVRDPGNVGTIIRTCCACGYDLVVNNCADIYSPKVTRSAMSALLKCRICADIDVEDIKRAGYELIAADMNGENVFTARGVGGKYCIVIGNEADGVSDAVLKKCDRILSIPQSNIESLNAAVAAGIMMYALRYQNN